MDSKSAAVEMFFFPFVGGGHQIPMMDSARVFAAHGAKSTIITTPSHALQLQISIARDRQFQCPDNIGILTLPEPRNPNKDIETDRHGASSTDTSNVSEPLKELLIQKRPDCVLVDGFHRWAAKVIDELGIPRIVFTGQGCFPYCAKENIIRHSPHENVNSKSEPFIIPGLPHRIEMTRSQLPPIVRHPSVIPDALKKAEENSFGILVNSFYELEPDYADYLRNEMGKKAWLVGPVSLCNKKVADKIERGKLSVLDEQICLNWLDSKEPSSVLYVSFGSVARLTPKQLVEIAHGLEASYCSFIWVVGKTKEKSVNEGEGQKDSIFPAGFEQRIQNSNKGLVIKGWAPQLLILEHEAIRGFMTHCGWNSILEAVTCGFPMITWPLAAEQFFNEKLVTDVLKIGVRVGSEEWESWNVERKAIVGREKVKVAVESMMGDSGEVMEMRKRAKDIADKAKRAFVKGGTSYMDVDALVMELAALCRQKQIYPKVKCRSSSIT